MQVAMGANMNRLVERTSTETVTDFQDRRDLPSSFGFRCTDNTAFTLHTADIQVVKTLRGSG